MPYQVDDALRHAMSGTELPRVRTELRPLPPPSLSTKDRSRREGPTLLCNQVKSGRSKCQVIQLRKQLAPRRHCTAYHSHASCVILNDNLGTLTDTTQQGSEVAGGLFVRSLNRVLLPWRAHSSLLSGGVDRHS